MRKSNITKIACAIFFAFTAGASAKTLQILGPAKNVDEIDLFKADQSGAYIKSIPALSLDYPVPIVKDLNGGFIIKLEGKIYYVGASDVQTNKQYDVSVKCDNTFASEQGAATRGVAGEGCK